MKTKKRKNFKLSKGMKGVAVLAGGAVGSSVIASAMPGTTGVPLQKVGTGLAKFVGPAVAVVGAGMIIKSLGQLPKPKKRKVKGGRR